MNPTPNQLEQNLSMRDLLIFELGIQAEANAPTDTRILSKDQLKEWSKRYHLSFKEIQNLYDGLNKKYVEKVIQ